MMGIYILAFLGAIFIVIILIVFLGLLVGGEDVEKRPQNNTNILIYKQLMDAQRSSEIRNEDEKPVA